MSSSARFAVSGSDLPEHQLDVGAVPLVTPRALRRFADPEWLADVGDGRAARFPVRGREPHFMP